jgi:hypothetical protein
VDERSYPIGETEARTRHGAAREGRGEEKAALAAGESRGYSPVV